MPDIHVNSNVNDPKEDFLTHCINKSIPKDLQFVGALSLHANDAIRTPYQRQY